jgi:hypothetical protein
LSISASDETRVNRGSDLGALQGESSTGGRGICSGGRESLHAVLDNPGGRHAVRRLQRRGAGALTRSRPGSPRRRAGTSTAATRAWRSWRSPPLVIWRTWCTWSGSRASTTTAGRSFGNVARRTWRAGKKTDGGSSTSTPIRSSRRSCPPCAQMHTDRREARPADASDDERIVGGYRESTWWRVQRPRYELSSGQRAEGWRKPLARLHSGHHR